MNTRSISSFALPSRASTGLRLGLLLMICHALYPAGAQTLLNVDFGVGGRSSKTGFAGTGQSTNDYWNLYRHYDPKFVPGMPLVSAGQLKNLKMADGSESRITLSVENAPGVWGNSSGDPMYDGYIYAQDGSNMIARVGGLEPGRYHFYFYGHADPDVTGEQNSSFTVHTGTNSYGPLQALGSSGWKVSSPWQERYQYVVFRDVLVTAGEPVVVEVAPSPNGIAVLNGLQIFSRGTSPPRLAAAIPPQPGPYLTNLVFREIRYNGQLSDDQARFAVELTAESFTTNEVSAILFEGDVALVAPELPPGLRIVSAARSYRLHASVAGLHQLKFELVARITRAEPWNQLSFCGPEAAIASVNAQAARPGIEIQLQSGVPLATNRTETSSVQGFLGADRVLAMRWQSRTAEVARKSLVAVDTVSTAQVTPTVVKFSTRLAYEILQAPVARVTVALAGGQSLTKVEGEQIRDWSVKPDNSGQVLTIEFIRPVDKSYVLNLSTEQSTGIAAGTLSLAPPQPLEIQRETGILTLSADDVQLELGAVSGLRQVNASAGTTAAFKFYGRPIQLQVRARRIEPIVKVSDRLGIRVEETRLLLSHVLSLSVEKAGIYALELKPQPGFVVSDLRGEGVDDWKLVNGALRLSFSSRVMGQRRLELQLEQPLKSVPESFVVLPLVVTGATNQTAWIGATAALGIRLKTAGELSGAREVPVASLPNHSEELLAYAADQEAWKLTIAAERLPGRMVTEVFNLVTVGDGLVGGSATIRYGLINQGVQEFRVRIPAHWKNVEFTGPNIRRKQAGTTVPGSADTAGGVLWTISLQDKAWGGYTLVITYDYQFNAREAVLDLAGAHPVGVERETGSVAVTAAANLKLDAGTKSDLLRSIDPTELAETDRALITRPVLLAYRYDADVFGLTMRVSRHQEVPVLDAVADRTQLTSVLTEQGEMLTQGSFMVKNNNKQYQKFRLPQGAKLWACYVNTQPVKGEVDSDWLALSLPRRANRDEAFAVDIVYVEKFPSLKSHFLPGRIQLAAPVTDVPNTFAEWNLFAPPDQRVSGFGGTMHVAPGVTYTFQDAWRRFVSFYTEVFHDFGGTIIGLGGLCLLLLALVITGLRRGYRGVLAFVGILLVVALFGAMLLPSLAKSKARAQRLTQAGAAPQGFSALSPGAMNQQQRRDYGVQSPVYDSESPSVPLLPPQNQPAPSRQQESAQISTAAPNVGGLGGAALVRQAPVAAGIRSIRIEIPRSGRQFTFTKVLNVREEPLSLSMSVMPQRWFQTWRSLLQAGAFLAGLIMFWRQWMRAPRSSLQMAAGMLLVVWAVASLLIGWRVLHWLFIALLPLLLMSMCIRIATLLWPRRAQQPAPSTPAQGIGGGTPPPAVALLIAGLWITGSLQAQEAVPKAGAGLTPPGVASNLFSLTSASYKGLVRERVGQFEVVLELDTYATNQLVALFGSEVALQDFSGPRSARLLRQGNAVMVRMADSGHATLRCKLVVKVAGEVARRQMLFHIPAALSSKVSIVLEEAEADVEFPTAVAFQRTTEQKQTRVDAILGAGDRVEMSWTPRVKRSAEIAASLFVQDSILASFGSGAVNTRATLDYQVAQGELRQMKVRLPQGQKLLRVEGEWIRIWELNEDSSGQVLSVELVKPVSPSYRLVIETEKPLDRFPTQFVLELPGAQGVIRETGVVGLRATEDLSLEVAAPAESQRVDVSDFARESKLPGEGLVSAYRYLKPGLQLSVRAEEVHPQVEAVMRNAVRIGFEQLSLQAQLDYTIKKAGVFSLAAALPPSCRIERVAGDKIAQWSERQEGGVRRLEVVFQERVIGNYSLRLELAQPWKDLPNSLSIPAVHPIGTDKLTCYIVVFSEQGIQSRTDQFRGLTEIPPGLAQVPQGVSLPTTGGVLAFKWVLPSGSWQPDSWALQVGNETVESWVRAEIVQVVSVRDAVVSGRTQVRFEVMNAPAKEFRLQVPAACKNVEIEGPNIRRRDPDGGQWRIELQNKIRGAYTLVVNWELAPDLNTNGLLQIPAVGALGVERETGSIVLMSRPPLQLKEKSASEQLVKVDVRELPDWAGINNIRTAEGDAPALVYRYLRPGYKLEIETTRFAEAGLLQALADTARFTTVVADDGQVMTELRLTVRNNGLQYLEIELPSKSTVWSAFVGGQPIRPGVRQGKMLLPLDRSGAQEAPVGVELIYVGTEKFPKSSGRVRLSSPSLNVPLKNARWDLYLPPDYVYDHFSGSMNHEDAPTMVAEHFTSGEYLRSENLKKAARNADLKGYLSNAKQLLASGSVKGANEDYNRAFINSDAAQGDESTRQELLGLKRELGKAQSSNLIQAQRAYTVDNFNRYAGDQLRGGAQSKQKADQAAQMVQYDTDVAEVQWERLQRAQEVTQARVQPLHINLPTQGIRHSFSQVLQTEIDKPVTVQFHAMNTTQSGWFGRIVRFAGGFILLWILAATAFKRPLASRG